MDVQQFQWDPKKAASNQRDHRVSFEEAIEVFHDSLARTHADPGSSVGELREIIVGTSSAGRLLLVSFTERGDRIRLISARPATRNERRDYEESR
jgi:uncharacterized protein